MTTTIVATARPRARTVRPGPVWAFLVGGLMTTAAVVLLDRSYPHRAHIIAVGFAIVIWGCVASVLTARRVAAAAAEEVAVLRLTLEVQEADCAERIAALEAELSTHSCALARLLAG
jgi:hypothetical protein